MRKVGATLVAGAVGLIGALALVSPAHAEPLTDSRTVSVQVNDRPDSATDGSTWAHDTFKRDLKIVGVGVDENEIQKLEEPADPCAVIKQAGLMWTYTVTGTDTGTFKTTDTNKSPQKQDPMKAGLVGKFEGDFEFKVTAPAAFCSFTLPPTTLNDAPSTSGFVNLLFGDDAKMAEKFTNWRWKYTLCNERWVNADDSRGGNKWDITGYSKLPCGSVDFVDTCDGVTVTLKNTAPSDASTAKFKVGLDGEWVEVKGGATVEVKVPTPTTEIKVFQKFIREPFTHEWKKPECATPTTPPATNPPATVPPASGSGGGSGLPVTGPQAALLSLAGALIVAAGIGVVVIARRRRVVTELPE